MSAESRRTGNAAWLLANLRLLRLLLHRRATLSGSSQLDWLLVGDAEGRHVQVESELPYVSMRPEPRSMRIGFGISQVISP